MGSSRNSTCGRLSSAVAISRRRSIPPESVRARRSSIGSSSIVAIVSCDPLAALAPRNPGDATVEVEVLVRGERAVHGDRLRDVADPRAYLEVFAADVVPRHERAPFRGAEQRGEHADRRRLARAVGPEQPEHLAGRHRERDAADRLELTEADHEVVHEHRGLRRGRRSPA